MANISKVNISNTDYKIKDSSAVAFGTCVNQASNQIKTVTISDSNWTLRTGCLIGVKFDANNAFTATADNPIKLNVNNSGAKNIYGANSSTPTGLNSGFFGAANYINFYMYDGTYWVWAGRSADNNTTYTAMTATEIDTGTATTARSITAKVLNDWLNGKRYVQTNAKSVSINVETDSNQAVFWMDCADNYKKTIDGVLYNYITMVFRYSDGYVGMLGRKDSDNTWVAIRQFIPSGAQFTDSKVTVTETKPTTGIWYYPVWATATSGTGGLNANNGLRYYALEGTALLTGESRLQVGNSTASGTAGNKKGYLRVYGANTQYAQIVSVDTATGNTTHALPDTSGTILNTGTTSYTATLTSGTKIGSITINGTSVDLYAPTDAATWNGLVDDHSTANTTDTWIPVYSNGKMQHTLRAIWSAKTHTNYNTNQDYLVTLSCLSYWNGAYNANNKSNLTYCNQGAFGTIVTKSMDDYVGTSTSSGRWYAATSLTKYASSNTANLTANGTNYLVPLTTSDVNLKENIKDTTINALEVVNNLQHRQFDYKYEELGKETEKIGYIAQELEEVIPESVMDIPQDSKTSLGGLDNIKQINYNKIIPYLTKAIQELTKIVEDQQVQINKLKKEIANE